MPTGRMPAVIEEGPTACQVLSWTKIDRHSSLLYRMPRPEEFDGNRDYGLLPAPGPTGRAPHRFGAGRTARPAPPRRVERRRAGDPPSRRKRANRRRRQGRRGRAARPRARPALLLARARQRRHRRRRVVYGGRVGLQRPACPGARLPARSIGHRARFTVAMARLAAPQHPSPARCQHARREPPQHPAPHNLSNELFASFLDETLTYSSAVFETEGANLADAQLAKVERCVRRSDSQRRRVARDRFGLGNARDARPAGTAAASRPSRCPRSSGVTPSSMPTRRDSPTGSSSGLDTATSRAASTHRVDRDAQPGRRVPRQFFSR
jgi:hypothetical protein